MMVPTVHPNGTSKQRLIESLVEASDALGLAYVALKQTAPNGRDYYVQGLGTLDLATKEHMDRLRRLDTIKAEIDTLILAIDKQGG